MNSERRRVLESFGNAPARLDAVLRQFPRRMWLYKKSSDCLSIHETVWLLADSEVVEYVHCRRFVAEPGSPALGIDLSDWPASLGYFHQDTKQALGIIRALRRGTYHFLVKLPETAWSRTVDLPTHGRLSLNEWLEIREACLPEHIQQMVRTYSEWFNAASAAKSVRSTLKTWSAGRSNGDMECCGRRVGAPENR